MKIKRRKSKDQDAIVFKGRPRTKREVITKRQIRSVELRLEGQSFPSIARQTGVSVTQAYKDVKNAFKKVDKELIEKADHLRTLELTRLDRLLEKLEGGYKLKTSWRVIGKGKNKKKVKIEEREVDLISFVHAYIKIMDRRSRYIVGLDAPKEVKADVGDNLKEAMETASTDLLTTLKGLAGESE